MKKTTLVFVVSFVLCLGFASQAWGSQSPDQAVKARKPPAKQAVPPVVTAQAVPQPAAAGTPKAAPPQAAPAAQEAPLPETPPAAALPATAAAPRPAPAQASFPPSPRTVPPEAPLAAVPAASPAPAAPEAAPHPLPAPAQQVTPAPQPVQMRKQVVKVNYIDAAEAWNILNAYKSPRGRIQLSRNSNTLIIEDTPDFVDKLLSILEELDVKPLDLMFTVDVILGSMEEEGGQPIPGSDRLLKELKSLLKYNNFARLDTSLIKVQDNGRTSQRMGGEGIGLMLELYPRHIKDGSKDGFQVELSLRQTTRRHERKDGQGNVEYIGSPLEKSLSLLQTSLMLVDGERSVVGVSKLNGGDTALILVIEGKVMK